MSNSTLKMIALVTMLIDHIGACIFTDQDIYRVIGRIAFPIYVFLLVEGYHKTRDVKKYILRLLIFALVSEIPFDLGRKGVLFEWGHQNVFLTLALGLILIWCTDTIDKSSKVQPELRPVFHVLILVAIMVASHLLRTDYVSCGITVIYIFYRFRSDDIRQELIKYALAAATFFLYYGWAEMPCVMAFPLIHFYNGKRGMKLKYAFYVFYPAHFLCIWLVKLYLLPLL